MTVTYSQELSAMEKLTLFVTLILDQMVPGNRDVMLLKCRRRETVE